MIRNILFDLDETLFDFGKAESIAIMKTLSHLGVDAEESFVYVYSKINDSMWKLLEKGQIERSELKVRRFAMFLEAIGVDADASQTAVFYENALSQGHYYIDGAENVIFGLKDRYNLYLVSNGTYKVQTGRLSGASITPCFKKIFISEKVGANKPSKEFFDICFSQIPDFDRSGAVIVGDSLTSDIQGGINAGIKTIWYDRKGVGMEACNDIVPDYRITDIRQLPDLIDDMSKGVVTCDK